jgi:hypothetical protein
MPHHNGASHSDQIIFLEDRHRRIIEKIDHLRRVVSFYQLARRSDDAKETGALRDATEWIIETAIELSGAEDLLS